MPERAFTPLFKTVAVAVVAGGGQSVPIPAIASAGLAQIQDIETVLVRVEGSGVAFLAINTGGAAAVIATSGGSGDMSVAAGSESVLGIPPGATQIALNCRSGDAPIVHLTFGYGSVFVGSGGGLGLSGPLSVELADNLTPAGAPFSATSTGVLFSQATSGYQEMATAITAIGTGNTITFEESNDNANWYPVNGYFSNDTDPNATAGSTATTTGMFICNCHGAYVRARVSIYGSGTVTVAPSLRPHPVSELGVFAPGAPGALLMSSDGSKATYAAAGLIALGANSWNDIVLIQGSATRTVRVKRVSVRYYGTATSGGGLAVQLIRRSSASSGGTSAAAGIAKFDINDPAATAAVTAWSAPTTATGTTAGIVGAQGTNMYTSASSEPLPIGWDFATREDKAVILRGAGDYLAINLNGQAQNSSTIAWEIWWEEDNS